MKFEEFSDRIQKSSIILELPLLSSEILQKLFKFQSFFLKWNKVINLSAHRSEEECLERNLIDSLVLNSLIQKTGKVFDFGAGGGFPGIVLKICNPSLNIVFGEADLKKSAFLNQAIITLDLKDAKVLTQKLTQKNISSVLGFDCIVSRATMDLEDLIKLFQSVMAKQGILLAMVSPHLKEEVLKIPQTFNLQLLYSYKLPFSQVPRKIISLIKL